MLKKILVVSTAVCGLLLLAGCGGSSYGSSPPHGSNTAHLSLTITTTSMTWGTVQVSYLKSGTSKNLRSCSSSSCSYTLPQGSEVTLSQSPASASTWPFKGWSVRNGSTSATMMGATVRLHVNRAASVEVEYVLASSSGSGSGW